MSDPASAFADKRRRAVSLRSGVVPVGKSERSAVDTYDHRKMRDAPTSAELRAAIPWVDGHADVWRLFADCDLFGRCVLALVSPYRNDDITHVAAVESRGFVLGGAAATALGAGFVAIRKAAGHLPGNLFYEQADSDYKGATGRLRLQADVLAPDARVLVVDDWFETGSQFRAARALLERAGATVVGASIIVDETAPALQPLLGKFRALIRADELSA
jgi:adenine phosphoribosyltransferase